MNGLLNLLKEYEQERTTCYQREKGMDKQGRNQLAAHYRGRAQTLDQVIRDLRTLADPQPEVRN